MVVEIRGQKTVIWVIEELKEAGFEVFIEEPGEYPVIRAVKGGSSLVIDTDKRVVRGELPERETRKLRSLEHFKWVE